MFYDHITFICRRENLLFSLELSIIQFGCNTTFMNEYYFTSFSISQPFKFPKTQCSLCMYLSNGMGDMHKHSVNIL